MMRTIKRYFRGVSIMTYTVLFIVLGFLFTLVVAFVLLNQSIGSMGQQKLAGICEEYAGIIQRTFSSAAYTLNAVKTQTELYAGTDKADRVHLRDTLAVLLKTGGQQTVLTLLIAPDRYDGKDSAFANTEYGTADGQLVCRIDRTTGGAEHSPLSAADEETLQHYARVKETGESFRSAVLTKTAGGKTVPYIVLYCPLQDGQGDCIGVASLELGLDDLFARIAEESIFFSGYITVTDESDRYIYHPKPDYINKTRAETLPSPAAPLSAGIHQMARSEDNQNHKSGYVAVAEAVASRPAGRFVVAVSAPSAEIYTEWIRLVIMLGVLGMLILCLILYYISRSIITPIKEITYMANLISHGDPEGRSAFNRVSPHMIRQDTRNEIHQLYITTRKMLEQLDQIQAMKLDSLRLLHEKERAEESTRTKNEFLARTSHEIRTPMNAIVGMSELILREELSDEARDLSVGIKRAGAYLITIIDDILDFTKIESGKMDINKQPYFFTDMLDGVISIVRMRILEKSMLFVVNTDADIPSKLLGDELRIRQILINLLVNAVKYTDKGYVRLTAGGSYVDGQYLLRFEVEDTGVGIRPEDLDRIFGDFIQVDQSRNRGIQGSGLGLAISKRLCVAMGGEITARSVYQQGSTFTVLLPQEVVASEPYAHAPDAALLHALLFETRKPYADSLNQSICNLGARCTVAESRPSFYEKLKTGKYSHIIVSSFLYEGVKGMVEDTVTVNGEPVKTVMLAKYGELSTEERDGALEMPAHAKTVAHMLGSRESPYASHTQGDIPSFTAPEARILIVDDIMTNLRVAEGLMSPYHMQIDICTSGAEAIAEVMKHRYDIVFMDHMMADMDGLEATAIIRAIESDDGYCQELPIVALTANAVDGVREMFIQGGMSDFLSKPIDMKKLDGILREWIPEEKQQMQTIGTARTQAETETELKIPGVDVRAGLKATGGRMDHYLATLSAFSDDGRTKAQEINNALLANDIPLYITYVHALKSACAGIGALRLSELSKLLEEAGRNNDILFVVNFTEDLLRRLQDLLRGIETALVSRETLLSGADAQSETGMTQVIRDEMENLRAALENMQASRIEESLSRLRSVCREGETEEAVRRLSRQVLLFNYEEAVELIDQILTD